MTSVLRKHVDYLLLLAAVALVAAIYHPIHVKVTGTRSAELQERVATLEATIPGLHAHIAASGALRQLDGEDAVSSGIKEIEGWARQTRQLIKKELERPAHGSESSEIARNLSDEQRQVLAGVQESLGTTLVSRFFGPEQFICYVLTVWAMLMIVYRAASVAQERRTLKQQIIRVPPGTVFTPERSAWLLEHIDPQKRRTHIGSMIARALTRYETSRDVAAAEAVTQSDSDAIHQQYDSELSMVRYVIWAVPSIGFIGTVRGMGMALGEADSPEQLSEVVGWLAVAFDTTLIALFLSILLMFVLHQYHRMFEAYVIQLVKKAGDELIHRLHVPALDSGFGRAIARE